MTSPSGAVRAKVVGRGDGRRTWTLGGLFTWKAEGPETANRWELVEIRLPRGLGAPLHFHHTQNEGFYVLAGELTYYLDGKETPVGPGDFAFVPPGTRHSFVVESKDATVLALISPAGLQAFFDKFGTPTESRDLPPAASGPPDPRELVASDAWTDQTTLGPVPPPRTPPR